MQNSNSILMIRPVHFTYNAQTAINNSFQIQGNEKEAQQKALNEFDGFVNKLRAENIDVTVIEDTPEPHTPDSIFPNNWISFHEDGTIVLYPMYAENRRAERKQHVLDAIEKKFIVKNIIDLTYFEKDNIFLEGTGSMVLDRDNKIAYACLSPRTNIVALEKFCSLMNYKPCCFHSRDIKGGEIYHTNVMMCVADKYVIICLDSISDAEEKNNVINTICQNDKEIIAISEEQLNHFAGNMIQLKNTNGDSILITSQQAHDSLTSQQQNLLKSFNKIVSSSLSVIEINGGGSARCMIAEVFLSRQK